MSGLVQWRFFVNIFNPSIHPLILPLQFIQSHCVTLGPLMQFMRMTVVISLLNYPLDIPIILCRFLYYFLDPVALGFRSVHNAA